MFFLGGTGLVLCGLDSFKPWSASDTSDGEYHDLADQMVGQALTDPTGRCH